MVKKVPRYAPEFRRQMVELHRAGRSFAELATEFGCTSWSIRQWVKQADRDRGRGDGGLTSAEREELARLRRENRKLLQERDILSKAGGLVCEREARDTEALFGFVKANQATQPVRLMCRLLRVSASGFYAWQERPMSARRRADIGLAARIHEIYRRSKGRYGSPNIHAELKDDYDVHVGRKRVARLMRAEGLKSIVAPNYVVTTIPDGAAATNEDLVKRQFKADGPDQLWVADATYVPTWAGTIYLAVVLDVWSHKIVGWAIEDHLRTELMLDALNMALAQRRPKNVIHHSDHGCQYTSYAFGKRCQEMNVMPSMGTVGDAYDNAMAESVFASLEKELLKHRRFKSKAEARMALFEWIEGWYNPHRRHSSIGRLSPNNFERRLLAGQAVGI
ncbi:MAG TPA: IS3 family transposase [Candidatus Baltobacteraceae bacterium]|nr:IS3 family transposase [Candidatus Baltobacteraceae bacterium]